MKRILTYIFILTFLLCSCGGRRDSRLAEADRVMEEHPDSALAILEAIDTATLKGEDNRALHALLLSYANFKNYYVPLNDTLLDLAVTHYCRHLNSAELLKSMFLKATNAIERGEYESAMGLLLQAEKISKLRHDTYWQAKIVEREADVLSKSFNFDQSARSYKKAAELYKEAGRIDNHRFALVAHANTAGNMNRYDYAFHIIDSVYAIADKEDYTALKRACVTTKFSLLVDEGRDSEAKHLYYDYPEEETKYLQNSVDLSRVARIWMNEGDMSKALEFLKKGESLKRTVNDTVSMYFGWRDYYRLTGNMPQTLAYSDSLVEDMAKSEYSIMEQSAIGQQRDYYEGIYDTEVQRVRAQRIIIICSIIVFLVIVAGGIVLHRYRMKLKAEELFNLGNKLMSLRKEMNGFENVLEQEKARNSTLINENKSLVEEKQILSDEKKSLTDEKRSLSEEKEMLSEVNKALSEARHTLSESNKALTQENKTLSEDNKDLFINRWRTIDNLCELYFQNNSLDENSILDKISRQIKDEIKKMRTSEFYERMEEHINKHHNNIVKIIRSKIHRTKQEDYNQLLLMLSGFSSSSICLLCGIEYNLYNTRRSRWTKQIKEKVGPDFPDVEKTYTILIRRRSKDI